MAASSKQDFLTGAAHAASQTMLASRHGSTHRSTVFSRSNHQDDEEALKWAALEKLPTYERLQTGILRNVTERGSVIHEEVDISKLGFAEKHQLVEKILHSIEKDNERFLLKLRERVDMVGIELPKIEVRFENINVEADVYIGTRALPTLYNFSINLLEGISSLIVPPEKHVLKILRNVSGVIKPSRMTLLLGPPSSGKTTLLLALAGKLSSDLRASGKVTYNGHEMTEFVPQRTCVYISQHDLQFPEMTVRETLDFCGRCQGVGSRYDMLLELSRREKAAGIKPDPDLDVFMKAVSIEGQEGNIVTDYILKLLGLDICADTLIGDQMRRGISGGQRKRVTTGEMLVGAAQALFMDEISTGLDSSTTFQIVKCLRQIVHVLDYTMLVSLLQPAPETFELFDDVILLSEGEIVYQGPRELILDYFSSMGFRCPERKNVADFLQEVTSRKDQAQYWADESQPYRYVPVKEFAQAFKSFHVGEQLQAHLSIPFDKSRSHPAALSTKKYGLPEKDLFKACFWREWLLMKRNSFLYTFQASQVAIVTVVTMTVFFRTRLHQDTVADANLYMGALFYGLVIIMFNGFGDMALVVIRLPVYYKQREQLFYPAWAYSVPTMIMRIPLSMLEALLWVCLTYYVIGFSPQPSRFFKQLLLFFWLSQMGLGLFRFIGSVGRSLIVATSYGTLALLIVSILGGFVISKDQIHKWWIWGFWSSPLMYAQNALVVNEFLADRWQKPYNGSLDAQTVGIAALKAHGFFTQSHWYWLAIGALIGFTILFNVLFTLALAYLNPLSKPQAVLSEESYREKQLNETSNSLRSPQLVTSRPTNGNQGFEGIDLTKVARSDVTNGADIAEVQRRGMVLPFQPLSIAFKSINYYVDMPQEMKAQGISNKRLQLLRDISGSFRPEILTALVGVSGAGKSTLMDVLAGRKTGGYIEGDIWISGYPKKQETFARISGYCEQNDVHSPNVTVLESLIYSAWLRLPGEIDQKTRMMFVEEVLELVELNPIRDALVGLPGVNGLSTEQRKRLTIAVELVANPSIIFMDEPTSGLDARAAAIVMRTVRNTVDTGRTVVCTIHQPSIDIFEAFDELLLLKRGGQVIYAGPLGPQSCHLVDYFQAIPGVAQITPGYNPATWMLDISSPAAEGSLGVDFAEIYEHSALYQQNQELIKELSVPLPGSKELSFETEYAQSFLEQCKACLWKQHWSYWRNPYYNVVRMLFSAGIGIIAGAIFWKLGRKVDTTQNVANIIGALYPASLYLGFSNGSTIQPVLDIERTVFYRERAAGMYSALPHALAQAAIEIPYVMFQTAIFVLLVYSMVNFEWTAAKFFYFSFFAYFTFLYFTFYGMMCVALTPNINLATILLTAVFTFWNLFSGYFIPRKSLPVWWRWYAWANPVQWTLYGVIASQLGDINTPISEPDSTGAQRSVKQYIEDTLGYKHDFLGVVVVMQIVWALLFVFIYTYATKSFNFQKR